MRPRSGEVDPELQRRKRVLRRVKEASFALSPTENLTVDDLNDRLGDSIDSFLRSLATASRPESGDAADELIEARRRLEQLVLDASKPMLRPYREVGKAIARTAGHVRDSLLGFLEALGADDLLTAETQGRTAQAHLDTATASLPQLSRARDDLQLAMSSGDGDGGLIELLARNLVGASEPGILGADQFGHATVQRIIGPTEPPVPGVGLGVLWGAALAQVIFDYDRFCTTAAALYRLIGAPGAFASLANDPEWRRRHERALTALFDSGDTLQRMLSTAPPDRVVARSLLLYVQDVFEGACKHFAATILAELGPDLYADLMANRRSASLVYQVKDDARTAVLAEGLVGRLRNSSGHYDFEVRSDRVVLDPGPNEAVYTAEEFLNELLSFVESAGALCLAFEVALMQRGVPTVISAGHPLLTPDYVLRLFATAAGLQDVQVIIEADTVSITGSGSLRAPVPAIGALLVAIPESATVLSIMWDEGDRVRKLFVPLSAVRAYTQHTGGVCCTNR